MIKLSDLLEADPYITAQRAGFNPSDAALEAVKWAMDQVHIATCKTITRTETKLPITCAKCTVSWSSILGGYSCAGSAEAHATLPIRDWVEKHDWVAPGEIHNVVCTIHIGVKPDECECGSGSNVRGPGHSHYCKLLEA